MTYTRCDLAAYLMLLNTASSSMAYWISKS